MNLDRLLDLAEAATPGPRTLRRYDHGGGRLSSADDRQLVADVYNEPDREYIAAASPEVVAALVRVAQAAQGFVSHMDGPEPRSGLWTTLKADREALRAALAEVTG